VRKVLAVYAACTSYVVINAVISFQSGGGRIGPVKSASREHRIRQGPDFTGCFVKTCLRKKDENETCPF